MGLKKEKYQIWNRLFNRFPIGLLKKPTGCGEIPIRPNECKTCHLAGCIAWEEFATGDPRIAYHKGGEGFVPETGDIVLYDRVFENREHDHIGVVIETRENTILTAEGNIDNRSGIIERPIDGHIRAYIRIPDGFEYGTA